MKFLLDTQLLLWVGRVPERLSAKAHELIGDADNDIYFSVVGIWEVAIKYGLRKADFPMGSQVLRRYLLENNYAELPIHGDHAIAVEDLPKIHKDPFDRLLIAQATVEGITLLTTDPIVGRYPGPIQLI